MFFSVTMSVVIAIVSIVAPPVAEPTHYNIELVDAASFIEDYAYGRCLDVEQVPVLLDAAEVFSEISEMDAETIPATGAAIGGLDTALAVFATMLRLDDSDTISLLLDDDPYSMNDPRFFLQIIITPDSDLLPVSQILTRGKDMSLDLFCLSFYSITGEEAQELLSE